MTLSSFSNALVRNPSCSRIRAIRLRSLLVFAALLPACADNPHRARAAEYYRDAQLCRAQNLLGPRAGTDREHGFSIDSETGVDSVNYLQCLGRLGYRQDAQTDPLLKALKVCRRDAQRPAAAVSARAGGESSGIDQAAFQECLNRRGVEGNAGH